MSSQIDPGHNLKDTKTSWLRLGLLDNWAWIILEVRIFFYLLDWIAVLVTVVVVSYEGAVQQGLRSLDLDWMIAI